MSVIGSLTRKLKYLSFIGVLTLVTGISVTARAEDNTEPKTDLPVVETPSTDTDTTQQQEPAVIPAPIPNPGSDEIITAEPETSQPPAAGSSAQPQSEATPPTDAGVLVLQLQAQLHSDGPLVPAGLAWRIFKSSDDPAATPELIASATGGNVRFELEKSSYIVHVSYGLASAIKRVDLSLNNQSETIDINAGGLQLSSVVGDGRPVAPSLITFDVFSSVQVNGQRKLLLQGAELNRVLRLNVGTYHIVSKYGETNAVVRADIRVQAGKLTNATIIHRAAKITLKFVNEPGGEALANTIWTVLTPGGDTVTEDVGAFPTMVLAEGDYTAIVKHEGKVYNRDFSVEAGVNRDIEVLLTVTDN